MVNVWAALQGMVEYTGVTGGGAGGGGRGLGRVTAWAGENQLALLAGVAVVLLLGMVARSRH